MHWVLGLRTRPWSSTIEPCCGAPRAYVLVYIRDETHDTATIIQIIRMSQAPWVHNRMPMSVVGLSLPGRPQVYLPTGTRLRCESSPSSCRLAVSAEAEAEAPTEGADSGKMMETTLKEGRPCRAESTASPVFDFRSQSITQPIIHLDPL